MLLRRALRPRGRSLPCAITRSVCPLIKLRAFASKSVSPSTPDEPAPRAIQPRVDYRTLAQNLEAAIANAEKRGSDADPALVVQLYEAHAQKRIALDALRAERNRLSRDLAQALKQEHDADHQDADALLVRGAELKRAIVTEEQDLADLATRLQDEALKLPNTTHPDVPEGDESCGRVVNAVGSKKAFDFEPKDHAVLGKELGLMDTARTSKVSGTKFVSLCNDGVRMEMALVQFTMNKLYNRGFSLWMPPDVAHAQMVEGCGFRPRGAEASQIYGLEGTDLCLAATAEIPLTSLHSDEVLATESLPLKYAGISHCFRREATHGSRETRGLFRLHQFTKVEMVGVCADRTQSQEFFDEMIAVQQEMATDLGLHVRLVEMPTMELGASAYRKIDVLAWMPGRNAFGEIASLSMCTDFQARRLFIRHKSSDGNKPHFVHTLNGTACAIPRVLISLWETHQQRDGSIVVPPVLRPYLGGQQVLTRRT